MVLLRSRKRKWRTIFVDTTSYGLSAIYGLCIGKSFFTSDISLYLLEVCHGDLWPTRRNGACTVEESSKSTRRRPWAEHEGRRLRDSSWGHGWLIGPSPSSMIDRKIYWGRRSSGEAWSHRRKQRTLSAKGKGDSSPLNGPAQEDRPRAHRHKRHYMGI